MPVKEAWCCYYCLAEIPEKTFNQTCIRHVHKFRVFVVRNQKRHQHIDACQYKSRNGHPVAVLSDFCIYCIDQFVFHCCIVKSNSIFSTSVQKLSYKILPKIQRNLIINIDMLMLEWIWYEYRNEMLKYINHRKSKKGL